MAFHIIKSRFESRNFTVTLVSLANAADYIGNETMAELQRIVDNKAFLRYPQTMPDLLRLALLVAHGGVYLDISTFFQGDVDWITGIARLPSRLIFNRFDPLPKVLMSHSIFYPNSRFWIVDSETKTKKTWLLHH